MEITPKEITLEIYTSLTDFEKSVVYDQSQMVQVVDNALQTPIDSLLTEDQNLISNPVDDIHSQWATATHCSFSCTSSVK